MCHPRYIVGPTMEFGRGYAKCHLVDFPPRLATFSLRDLVILVRELFHKSAGLNIVFQSLLYTCNIILNNVSARDTSTVR